MIDWVDYKGGQFCRISDQSWQYNFLFSLDDNQTSLTLNEFGVKEKDIKSIWLRRSGAKKQPDLSHIDNSYEFKRKLSQLLWRESDILRTGLLKMLKNKPCLSSFETITPNKIDMLLLAKQARLTVPATCITASKKEMLEFIKKYHKVITKNISDADIFNLDTLSYMQYTEEITPELLDSYDDNMYACLLQEKIEKEVELRIFYLHGNCYGMAIFSQLDDQTATDFRNYNTVTPNRNVPYQLPKEIEENIRTFMKSASLDTGSIDMIKTHDDKYIFLEVNPVGQFGMTSYPCNYFLEEKIADWLLHPTSTK